MIRYDLICGEGHAFDAWFSDSASFDEQAQAGLVECPICGDARVRKQLMTPALATRVEGRRSPRAADDHPGAASADGDGAHDTALMPTAESAGDDAAEEAARRRALVRALHAHVRRHADYVGRNFAEEARRRAALKKARPAWGEATREEVGELLEEGITVLPLPPAPDEKN